MLRSYILILLACLLMNCTQASSQEGHPIIQAYSNAYNEKDIETLKALMHPDIEWIGVTGNNIEVHVSGKDTLAKEMETWFENPKLPKGTLRDWSLNGNHVAVTETAHWTTDAGDKKSQSALTVYQIENDLVRRVYYYPATSD